MKKTLPLLSALLFAGMTCSAIAQQSAPAATSSTDPIVQQRVADKAKRDAFSAKKADLKKIYDEKVAKARAEMQGAKKDDGKDPIVAFRTKRAEYKKEYNVAVQKAHDEVYGAKMAKAPKNSKS